MKEFTFKVGDLIKDERQGIGIIINIPKAIGVYKNNRDSSLFTVETMIWYKDYKNHNRLNVELIYARRLKAVSI